MNAGPEGPAFWVLSLPGQGVYRASCDDRGQIVPHPGDNRVQPQPGSVRGPRVGRLATVNSLKPDATWIRARSARGGTAAVSLLGGRG